MCDKTRAQAPFARSLAFTSTPKRKGRGIVLNLNDLAAGQTPASVIFTMAGPHCPTQTFSASIQLLKPQNGENIAQMLPYTEISRREAMNVLTGKTSVCSRCKRCQQKQARKCFV